ncbi:MAG TPA: NifB/NifX family molybdenum-iron cluster-binding protein [Candidatus Hydrogenedentes bacterium]|nr:NifB/NifX family molybdenum-iron cluster-binding protein [Candidatus Hydrogenedentota bacterium]HIJ72490.1 NifB/NifX family molybdenum-iron cluster-binding protein [Candidatus Hydrogenedentota bacterium]
MRVAIPTWSGRISPVFDVAERLLLVEVEDGVEVGRREERMGEAGLARRAMRMADLGVEVLICGALSNRLEAMLTMAGVQVIPHTCGCVEEVLGAYLRGQLTERAFLMPGCCGRGRRGPWGGPHRGRHGPARSNP